MSGSGANQPPPGQSEGRRRRWSRSGRRGDDRGRSAADRAYERSAAGEQERLITEALVDLRDMDVREVMTPRTDVVALTIPVTAEDVAQAIRESGHRCFPVVHDDLDDLVGLLFVNDLFRSRRTRSGRSRLDGDTGEATTGTPDPSPLEISRRLRQPYVVPESRRILEVLAEMRQQRRGFAVVVDEYGGVAGVLTVKDLLEPLVGELHDEFDPADDEPAVVRVDGSRWLVDGRASVDDVRDRLGMEVPDGDYVTLAGFLLDGLGHIPEEGETLRVDGWDLRVQEMDKRRIVNVIVRRVPEAAGGEDGSGGAGPGNGDGDGDHDGGRANGNGDGEKAPSAATGPASGGSRGRG
ncbi:MAG TPA: hemolysin family protein [Acidimicrobiales bacterium]|nr:hemolysin family protein [Acidimicrobiales bacterium]